MINYINLLFCQCTRDINTVLCQKVNSDDVTCALNRLKVTCVDEETGVDDTVTRDNDICEVVDNENDVEITEMHDEVSIRQKSPFTQYFNKYIQVNDENDNINVEVNEQNIFHNPGCFMVINDLMFLFPMWSAILQSDVVRHASDAASNCETNTPLPVVCRSNAIVESHFAGIKRRRLPGNKRMRPRQVALAELAYVNGKLSKMKMPRVTPGKLKKSTASLEGITEF